MSDTATCRGCKHLLITRGRGWCLQPMRPAIYSVDPTTGTGRWVPADWKAARTDGRPPLSGWSAPACTEMREQGGPCGPERRLFEPNWRRRVWARLKRIIGGGRA